MSPTPDLQSLIESQAEQLRALQMQVHDLQHLVEDQAGELKRLQEQVTGLEEQQRLQSLQPPAAASVPVANKSATGPGAPKLVAAKSVGVSTPSTSGSGVFLAKKMTPDSVASVQSKMNASCPHFGYGDDSDDDDESSSTEPESTKVMDAVAKKETAADKSDKKSKDDNDNDNDNNKKNTNNKKGKSTKPRNTTEAQEQILRMERDLASARARPAFTLGGGMDLSHDEPKRKVIWKKVNGRNVRVVLDSDSD